MVCLCSATLHIGGQIGWDKNKTLVSNEFIGQMEQALTNIVEIVRVNMNLAVHNPEFSDVTQSPSYW